MKFGGTSVANLNRIKKAAKTVKSKIINEKNPKINYLVGGFLEKKITLKSLLSDKIFQKIIMKLYN